MATRPTPVLSPTPFPRFDHEETRPPGITLLALLYFGGGLFGLGAMVLGHERLRFVAELLGTSPYSFAIHLGLFAVNGVVSGIGMWCGKAWA